MMFKYNSADYDIYNKDDDIMNDGIMSDGVTNETLYENLQEKQYDDIEPKLNIESLIEWYKLNGIRQFYLNEENLLDEKMLKKDSIQEDYRNDYKENKSLKANNANNTNNENNENNKRLLRHNTNIQKHSKEDMLADLKERMLQVECDLKYSANNFVFADGDCNASVMIVGEAPGEEEDIQSKPFVGRSGQLLRKALEAMGIDNFYITNVVPFRPPYNRQPTDAEISLYLNFLKQHISIVRPKILLMAGSISMNAVLKTNLLFESDKANTISKMRGLVMNYSNEFMNEYINEHMERMKYMENKGEWVERSEKDNANEMHSSSEGNAILCMPIFHPSYLLRSSSKKVEYVKDLFLAKELCEIL